MRTDVWNKLPDQPPNMEGQIIDLVFEAERTFWQVVPHPPYGPQSTRSAWKKWAVVTHAHPQPTFHETASWTAVQLLQAQVDLDAQVRSHWDQLWTGDPSITPDKCFEIVAALGLLFASLDQEHKAAVTALPSIKRPYGKEAPEVFFSQLLSLRMASIYGKPLDAVVAALTSVAFDLPGDGVSEETVRSRRR
jgi:hypothetical protein